MCFFTNIWKFSKNHLLLIPNSVLNEEHIFFYLDPFKIIEIYFMIQRMVNLGECPMCISAVVGGYVL